MRLLFLSAWFPYPPNNGSKQRIYHLLRGLAQEHTVDLISFAEKGEAEAGIEMLRSICPLVRTVPLKHFNPKSHQARFGYLALKPRSIIDTFCPEMVNAISSTLSDSTYDAVIASQINMAAYRPTFRDLPALFEEAEVGVLYDQFRETHSFRSRCRHGLTWIKHKTYLRKLLRDFQFCTVVSERERELVERLSPGRTAVHVIPNGADLSVVDTIQEEVQPDTLIFTGPFSYFANYEAMVWFQSEVYPRIRAEVPDVRLSITGDHSEHSFHPAENVTLTGRVDDVRPLVARSWCSIVPLKTGGGTRLKILEAMALRTPVVSTSKGAEGLQVENGRHLLIADTVEDFGVQVVRLLGDPALRERLAENSFRLVSEQYSWEVLVPQFLKLVGRLQQPKN